jgi:hypothetical protein
MRRGRTKSQRSFSAGFHFGQKRASKRVGRRAFRAGFNKAKVIGIRKLNHQRHGYLRQYDPEQADYEEYGRQQRRHID